MKDNKPKPTEKKQVPFQNISTRDLRLRIEAMKSALKSKIDKEHE